MNVMVPTRRLVPRCLSYRPRMIASHIQNRAASSNRKDDSSTAPSKYLEDFTEKLKGGGSHKTPEEKQLETSKELLTPGDISSGSIFEDTASSTEPGAKVQKPPQKDENQPEIDEQGLKYVLDPRPNARVRWETRKVMKMVRHGGRMTKREMVARTEREHLAKSQMMKTSVKKLMMLARQIAGKSLDEAITQMDFSKKKAARDVSEHLHFAKHEAVVSRGMGLGQVAKNEANEELQTATEPVQIRLKNNKKYTVSDPTKLYIDQAWVGRGPFGRLPDYRGRGKVFMMRTPWTSLTVVLKEEATRIREHTERQAKDKRKRMAKVWQHLPDKPLIGPRGQYYSW